MPPDNYHADKAGGICIIFNADDPEIATCPHCRAREEAAASKKTVEPKSGIIVSDGKMDFLVHHVAGERIYGVKYPTTNRGDVKLGDFRLIKTTRTVWEQAQPEIKEVVNA